MNNNNNNNREEQNLIYSALEYNRLLEIRKEIKMTSSPNLLDSEIRMLWAEESGYQDTNLLEDALLDGREARDFLITSNMRLVYSVVNQICKSSKGGSLTYDDLVQEGSMGLAKALQKFDPDNEKHAKFSTYAYYWIRATILRAISSENQTIRIPEYIISIISKVRQYVETSDDFIGQDFESFVQNWSSLKSSSPQFSQELAKQIGITEKKLDEVMMVESRRRKGMVVMMYDKQEVVESTLLRSRAQLSLVEEEQEKLERKESIMQVLESYLKPKELMALSLRYGLLDSVKSSSSSSNNNSNNAAVRDYEQEAEADLFGPQGMMRTTQEEKKRQTIQSSSYASSNIISKGGRWGEAMTFKEVGKQMRVSGESGRKLCAAALAKLKAAVKEG
eukprot:CAMPEP_0178948974 /NCGR_PEP_ID=MMETSP0789-20121207/5771_1 /TAXON_ID=3005 /ORGANISM="Rhizosolenia setigera, Strain CCMP 1694" /LENGTH=390 /DNA_ID=CAMNT_0020629401 /DNA_START=254 /DNA_END=1422 /DNA_ORIENTATION=+